MGLSYKITSDQGKEIASARKENRDKKVEKRLHAVQLRYEGKSNKEIALQLDTSSDVVSRWIATYAKDGLAALLPKKPKARNYNMTFAEEADFLSVYEERAQAGQIVEISEIKAAYEEKVGHRIGGGQIYRVLKRHNWRKVKPRSKHPKKASAEAIDASKKLTWRSEKKNIRLR